MSRPNNSSVKINVDYSLYHIGKQDFIITDQTCGFCREAMAICFKCGSNCLECFVIGLVSSWVLTLSCQVW